MKTVKAVRADQPYTDNLTSVMVRIDGLREVAPGEFELSGVEPPVEVDVGGIRELLSTQIRDGSVVEAGIDAMLDRIFVEGLARVIASRINR